MRSAWLALLLVACARGVPEPPPAPWVELFDGASLTGWRTIEFGGEGEVYVAHGRMVLARGEPLTGVAWTGAELPRSDYELELVARKLEGTDFFVGLTFPVGESHLTLVLGGWGGALCGLSCLDGEDASGNETKFFEGFDVDRDYRVGVRVDGPRVTCTLDGARVVDIDTTGREVSLRTEVEPCRPLGLSTFLTKAGYASLRVRRSGP